MTSDYQGFLRWFVGKANSDPHSTRLIESMTAYASESTGAAAFASIVAPAFRTRRDLLARARAVRCPLLVFAGTEDEIAAHADAAVLAREAGGRLIIGPERGSCALRSLARRSSTSSFAASSTRHGATTDDRAERARCYPDEEGFVERDGVRVFWERYGEGETTILFLPAWSVVHSRLWKAQIPYFGRHYRVLAFDPRGNGRSDKPADPAAYADVETVGDAIAVMDATGTERVIVVGVSMGGWTGALLAGLHPERVDGAVLIGPVMPARRARFPSASTRRSWRRSTPRRAGAESSTSTTGGATSRASRSSSPRKVASEPPLDPAGRGRESWILETTPESLIASAVSPGWDGSVARALREDRLPDARHARHRRPGAGLRKGVALAEAIGVPLVTLEGMGHAPEARYPVKTNILIREFVESVRAGTRARPGEGRREGMSEPLRARYPDEEGFVERDGVRVGYELYEGPEPTVLFVAAARAEPRARTEADACPTSRGTSACWSSPAAATGARTARQTPRRTRPPS